MADAVKYRVTGGSEVLGHPPGSVFEADLPEAQEESLIAGGHLAKAQANAKVQDTEPVLTPAARAAQIEEANKPATAAEAAELAPIDPAAEPADQEEEK